MISANILKITPLKWNSSVAGFFDWLDVVWVFWKEATELCKALLDERER
jgi:hypothetical protein